MLGITNKWTAQPCQHNVVSRGEPSREVLPKRICCAHMEAADFATSYWEQGQPNNFPTSNHQVNFAIFQGYGICCITDHFGHLVEDLPGNKSWKHLRKRGRPNQSLLVLVPSFVLGRCFQRLQPRFLPNLCCSPFENTAIQLSPTWNVCHPLHFPILLNPLSLSLSIGLGVAPSQRDALQQTLLCGQGDLLVPPNGSPPITWNLLGNCQVLIDKILHLLGWFK